MKTTTNYQFKNTAISPTLNKTNDNSVAQNNISFHVKTKYNCSVSQSANKSNAITKYQTKKAKMDHLTIH